MQRRNGPAIRDTLICLACWGRPAYLGYHFWGTQGGAHRCFIAYGLLYGTASGIPRWHECGHYRTAWLKTTLDERRSLRNRLIYGDSRIHFLWRWSYTRGIMRRIPHHLEWT